MVKDLGKLKSNQTDAVLGGYLAEHWHAGTFNINAAATESLHRAKTLGSTEYASVDIATNFGQSYSSKYMGQANKVRQHKPLILVIWGRLSIKDKSKSFRLINLMALLR